jgi:hypothetical protein
MRHSINSSRRRWRTVCVTFADGNTLDTEIRGTEREIIEYYLGQQFQFGDTEATPADNLQTATEVKFLDVGDD